MIIRTLVVGALLTSILPVNLSEAATVRRHLHCLIGIGFVTNGGLIPTGVESRVVATNNWTFTIPKGTVFTYRLGSSSTSRTLKSNASLAPNKSIDLGASGNATSCDVTIPG